jgi:hypothetical protein
MLPNNDVQKQSAEEVPQKKEKTPQSSLRHEFRCVNFGARHLARFHHTQQNVNLCLTGLITGPFPGIEQQIISSIKTIRKRN